MISTINAPNRSVGVPLVMIAGICWSTSGLIYRLIENASPWQVLFYRSLALFVMLAIWLGVNYRKNFSVYSQILSGFHWLEESALAQLSPLTYWLLNILQCRTQCSFLQQLHLSLHCLEG
ncbi:MAG: hypothetical protein QGH27_08050 [SAR324 cluster bacterium]|nr:hypothetical protein [SAR324 cluster bacterium]